MCCSVINASEMQTAVQVVFLFFFHSYFCLLMFALILKCCCILLSHNIETTDMPQRRLCRCCWETLNSTVRAELWSVPKHEEKQHGDDQAHLKQERQVAQKKNAPGRNLIKLRVECVLGKKQNKNSSIRGFTLSETVFGWASRVGGRPAIILIVCQWFQCCGLSPSLSLCVPVCV